MPTETLFPDLRLHNTLTRRKEVFTPTDGQTVHLYCCGPTVYNYAHIGNLRTYLFEDLLRRVLEWRGWQVRHVVNITDVGHMTSDADAGEDKMMKAAAREHKSPWEIARFYEDAFLRDLDRLNIRRPTVLPRATEHVSAMIALIRATGRKRLYVPDERRRLLRYGQRRRLRADWRGWTWRASGKERAKTSTSTRARASRRLHPLVHQ